MFCKSCGTKRETMEDKFCKNCGEELINQLSERYYHNTVRTVSINQIPNKNILSGSVDTLKMNIASNIPLVLLSIVSFILLSSTEYMYNIPYIYIIFKVMQCIVISLITMKMLLQIEEFKEAINHYNKNIIIWITTFIVTCIAIEIIDGILIIIGNSILSNIDYYRQATFIDNFNLGMLFIEGVTTDSIVTIVTYITVFKVISLVKCNMRVSLKEVFENLKNNINYIIILLVITETVSFFSGLFLGTKGLIYNLISVTIVFIWIAIVTVIPYLDIENSME